MDPQQQFCLKWNSFGSNLATAFSNLFKSETLADVTLFCEGVTFKAHKLILAACSKHLAELFETAPNHQNLLVILDGTSAQNMGALLEFMYKGEVHVAQESLSSFLKAADCLQVKGLSIEHEKLAVAQSQQQLQPQPHQMLIPSSTSLGPRNKSSKLSSPLMTSHDSLKADLSHHQPHLFQPQHLSNLATGSSGHPSHHSLGHGHGHGLGHNLLPQQQSTPHLSSYSPILSPYLNQYHRQYETHLPQRTSMRASPSYNLPKKRHLRTNVGPSLEQDAIRASVLRDGSKSNGNNSGSAERETPTSSLTTGQSEIDQSLVTDDHLNQTQNTSNGSYDIDMSTTSVRDEQNFSFHDKPTIVVENSIEITSEIDSNCPEDLRVKSETDHDHDHDHDLKEDISTSTSYSNGSGIVVVDGCSSSSNNLRNNSPHLAAIFQQYANTNSNVNSSSAHSMFENVVEGNVKSDTIPPNMWSTISEKYLKKPNCVNTPEGRKLKCPFCERLYGYETNLRAHIRQRHQGIRVPCPFCPRTFTRNNTVRRHIAREHKTDLSLKAYHEVQSHHSHTLQQQVILHQQLQQQQLQQQQQQQQLQEQQQHLQSQSLPPSQSPAQTLQPADQQVIEPQL